MINPASRAKFAGASKTLLEKARCIADTHKPVLETSVNPILAGSAIGIAAAGLGRGLAAIANQGISFASELAKSADSAPTIKPPQAPEGSVTTQLKSRKAVLQQRLEQHLATAGIQLTQP